MEESIQRYVRLRLHLYSLGLHIRRFYDSFQRLRRLLRADVFKFLPCRYSAPSSIPKIERHTGSFLDERTSGLRNPWHFVLVHRGVHRYILLSVRTSGTGK